MRQTPGQSSAARWCLSASVTVLALSTGSFTGSPRASAEGAKAPSADVQVKAHLPEISKEQLQKAMADTIAGQAGVSAEEVLAMFDASAAFGDAVAAVENDSAYAGSWIEYGPKLDPLLVVAALPGQGERLRSVVAKYTSRIRIEVRPFSYETLSAESKRLVAGRAALTSISVDVRIGRLVIRTSSTEETEAYLAKMSPTVPVAVQMTQSVPSPVNSVSGGVGMWWNTTGFNCTSGFSLLNGAGATAILTAGHCTDMFTTPPSMPGDPDWVALGQPQNLVFAGSQDRQIHVVPSPHYARGRFATLWGWAQPTGRQNPVLNEFVCKTGQTTSSTCWNVANINVSIPQNPPVYPSAMNNLFEGNNLGGPTYVSCAGGDSGGPIWNGNVRAVGIVHGASGNAGLPHVCIGAKILAQIPNGWEIGT